MTLETAQGIAGAKNFTAGVTQVSKRLQINGIDGAGMDDYPHMMLHIPGKAYAKFVLEAASKTVHLLDGGATAFNSYRALKTGDITAPKINITGSANSSAYITADYDDNIYINVGGRTPLVITNGGASVRPSLSQNGVFSLGEASSRWSAVYANGGDFAGLVTIKTVGHGNQLNLFRNESGSAVSVKFTNTDGVLGYIGIGGSGSSVPHDAYYMRGESVYRIWHSGNDGAGSGLDADLLDGYHEGSFFRGSRGGVAAAFIDDPGNNYSNYAPGTYSIGRGGYSEIFINFALNFGGSTSALQLKTSYQYDQPIYYRKTVDSNRVDGGWRYFITSYNIGSVTAGAAVKLANTRYLWGNAFNGEGDVSGTITSYQSYPLVMRTTSGATDWLMYYDTAHIYFIPAATKGSTTLSAYRPMALRNDGWVGFAGWAIVAQDAGNVGIGYNTYTPTLSYKLDVNGDIRATSRIEITSTGGFHRSSTNNPGSSWNWGEAAFATGIQNNGNQTPILMAVRAGAGWDATGANRLFAMELLNSGGQLWMAFGGAQRYQFTSGGVFYASAGIWSNGYVSGKGNAGSSDARLKRGLEPIELTVRDIAGAPLVEFDWVDGSGRDMGTIAQYWLTRCKRAVRETPDGYYALDYGKLAVAIGISLARTVADHERRLDKHEMRLDNLEMRIAA